MTLELKLLPQIFFDGAGEFEPRWHRPDDEHGYHLSILTSSPGIDRSRQELCHPNTPC